MSQHPAVEQLVPLVREETEQKSLHWDYLYEPDDSRDDIGRIDVQIH